MTEQTINKQTHADLNFQERLDEHSKQALIFLVDQLTSVNRKRRGWVLKYLRGVEALMRDTGITTLRNSILEAIANERLAQDCQRGPIKMRPRTLDEWTHKLSILTTQACAKAGYGQRHEALKAILNVAAEAVAALEDRIDAEAEAGKEVLASAMKELVDKKTADVNRHWSLKIKKADPDGTGPAVQSESSIN